jgi:hypothetical protein
MDIDNISGKTWANWAERLLAGEHLEEEMQNAGALPNWETPLPPTNATLHILDVEYGYGTPQRTFVMVCGVRWKPRESSGEHKYFFQGDTGWHKHVNCAKCREVWGLEPTSTAPVDHV